VRLQLPPSTIAFVKKVGLIVLFLMGLAVAGCGSSSGKASHEVVVWRSGKPVGLADQGAPPKKLIVKDVKVGSGKVLRKGSVGTFRYRNFDYRTGQNYEDWWQEPFHTGFGKGESLGAWETGLKGMRVGGIRELVVPAKEAYGHVPEIYVLKLVAVS
jgi:peptidylprolyl isomerase